MENIQIRDFRKILKGLRTDEFANLIKFFFIEPGIKVWLIKKFRHSQLNLTNEKFDQLIFVYVNCAILDKKRQSKLSIFKT
jgi:hypothetical protein